MDRRITRQLVERARGQQGLLRAADVDEVDPARSLDELVRSGNWQEVLPGVVAPAAVEVTAPLLESAAMLWAPQSRLSHESAARRSGFWVPDADSASIITPFADPRRSMRGVTVSRTRQYPQTHMTDQFHRWTMPARTLVDLAARLTRRQLEATLLSAVRKKVVSADEVRLEAQQLRKRSTTQLVFEVVALWTAERESFLEDVLFGDVKAVVTERVERQYVVQRRDGRVQARLDVAVPELLLDFEADGLFFHSTDDQIAADQKRDRALFTRGWHTARFREGVLDNRAAVRAEIRAIVERRRQDRRAA
jgi:very-short-patch-repair endonuclease